MLNTKMHSLVVRLNVYAPSGITIIDTAKNNKVYSQQRQKKATRIEFIEIGIINIGRESGTK